MAEALIRGLSVVFLGSVTGATAAQVLWLILHRRFGDPAAHTRQATTQLYLGLVLVSASVTYLLVSPFV